MIRHSLCKACGYISTIFTDFLFKKSTEFVWFFSCLLSTKDVGHWSPYDAVISTAPTYSLQKISTCRNTRLRELLSELSTLSYSAISILFLGFKDVTSRIPLTGFGCLAPTRESRGFLGMTFTTSSFEGRTPEGGIGVNFFLGGGRNPKQARLSQEEAVAKAMHELHELFGIEKAPQTVAYRQWLRAIPQYELGYEHYESSLKAVEEEFPGLFLAGNYRDGIGVPDAIRSGVIAAKRVAKFQRTS